VSASIFAALITFLGSDGRPIVVSKPEAAAMTLALAACEVAEDLLPIGVGACV
jgi:hypothetical protein